MKRRIAFNPAAERELTAAAEWYDERRPGLGVELVAEVDEAAAEIAERPEAWPRWRPDRPYRKRLLQRFPYVVFYVTKGTQELEIVALAHQSRKPGYWLERGTRGRRRRHGAVGRKT